MKGDWMAAMSPGSLLTALGCAWLLGLASPAALAERVEIIVSAAISLKNAFEEIAALHVARGGARPLFNFGGSGELARQILGGAPVDVFASAAQQDMDTVEGAGLLLPGSRANFAGNRLVLVVPAESKLALSSFKGLASKGVERIAVGNPRTVPAGRYAEQVLIREQLLPVVRDKLIFGENVRQVLDYVVRGEVDAGIVYATDAAARANEVCVAATAMEDGHESVVYPIGVIRGGRRELEAKSFLALVLAGEGQAILRRHGFSTLDSRQAAPSRPSAP